MLFFDDSPTLGPLVYRYWSTQKGLNARRQVNPVPCDSAPHAQLNSGVWVADMRTSDVPTSMGFFDYPLLDGHLRTLKYHVASVPNRALQLRLTPAHCMMDHTMRRRQPSPQLDRARPMQLYA